MLKDITTLTALVLDDILNSSKDVSSKKTLYDTYQKLNKVIVYTDIVANHYLVLDFTEDGLQNSSFGEPRDKWRFFLNKDLEALNSSAKEYLLDLGAIALKDEEDSFISKTYNCKWFYGFVRGTYNVGLVKSYSTTIDIVQLNLPTDDTNYLKQLYKTIELDTYEKRVTLQSHLLKQNDILKQYKDRLINYISKKVTINDLL